MTASRNRFSYTDGQCQRCGKIGTFRSRKAARAARRRLHPGEKLHAYECGGPGSGRWHIGHDEMWRREANLDETQVALIVRLHEPAPYPALAQMARMAVEQRAPQEHHAQSDTA